MSKTPVAHTRKLNRPAPVFKNMVPVMQLTRKYQADNLKLKAEELIQRRVMKERRKNTEDIQLEKLVANNKNNNSSGDETENNITYDNISPKKTMVRHKESIARPLNDESEDESTTNRWNSPSKNYHNSRVSENISRLMDEKRSTIKEQVEDEEEFTGSSLNVSQNLHFIRSSGNCKKKEKDSLTSKNKESEPQSKTTSKRKNSDYVMSLEATSPIDPIEKPRKFTDNLMSSKQMGYDKEERKTRDQDNSTIEGTSVVTPFMYSRHDSGFEAYATSALSTPTMQKGKVKRVDRGERSTVVKNNHQSFTSKISMYQSITNEVIENSENTNGNPASTQNNDD